MSSKVRILIALIALLCIAIHPSVLAAVVSTTQVAQDQPNVEKTPAGYRMATTPRTWSFPLDHGRHDGFKTEWWYFAGNVADTVGRKFGYQLTFFRVSISPFAVSHDSAMSLGDYYFAHAALSDLEGGPLKKGEFYFKDRMDHEHAGVTASAADTLDVSLHDWFAKLVPAGSTTQPAVSSTTQPDNVIALDAIDNDFGIHLNCTPIAEPVLQGPGGVNPKGRAPGQASYYYSIPRLPTTGTIMVGDKLFHVTGTTWMDHEFSSNALGANQIGWDWVGLRLTGGNSLMVYRLRNKAGGADFLSGTLIDAAGHPKYLTDQDITFTPSTAANEIWKSDTGGAYPQQWNLSVAGLPPLLVRSRMRGQELRTDATTKIDYFEGSCQVTTPDGKAAGEGYLEMTGYAKPISPF